MRGKKCFNTIWGKICHYITLNSKIFNKSVTADAQESLVTAKCFSIYLVRTTWELFLELRLLCVE